MPSLGLRDFLLILLGATALFFVAIFARAIRANRAAGDRLKPGWLVLAISFVAAFFDTLGIGSFATTTSGFRRWNVIPDERLPGTLNIGYVVPTIAQAFIFVRIVPVDAVT